MNPLSHTALEPLGDDVEPPIANLPDEVFAANIFPYLESRNLSHTGQVCRRFNTIQSMVWQRRAQELSQACARWLPSFGMAPLGPNPSPAEATTFLEAMKRRVREINTALPENLRSSCSADDLACKVGPGHMQEFLQKAYDHSLRTVFGGLAHVPAGASPEASIRLIKDWLQTAEAGTVNRLDLLNCRLFCLPNEIGQLTALRELHLYGNQLTSLPPEIGQLTALQWLDLAGNQLTSLPPEIGQLKALQWFFLQGNQISSLPSEIEQLKALHHFFLSSNRLASLLPTLGRLAALVVYMA